LKSPSPKPSPVLGEREAVASPLAGEGEDEGGEIKNTMSTGQARSLRKSATPAEQLLWRHLRGRQLNGRKWRRQQPFGPYVLDFYCPELRIAVEIDGDVHAAKESADRERQRRLENRGITVVRFTNREVLDNLEGVLSVLWDFCSRE
jgi:very-short-patch-repair endonuclease